MVIGDVPCEQTLRSTLKGGNHLDSIFFKVAEIKTIGLAAIFINHVFFIIFDTNLLG